MPSRKTLNLIQRATSLFGEVLVAVLKNPIKVPAFDVETRIRQISQATSHIAGVEVIRPNGKETCQSWHSSDILFTFVMEGSMTLEGEDKEPFILSPGDAFVIPPNMKTAYKDASPDLELLEVSLPGTFETTFP